MEEVKIIKFDKFDEKHIIRIMYKYGYDYKTASNIYLRALNECETFGEPIDNCIISALGDFEYEKYMKEKING